jgi:type I restriction enzyme S subunit
LVSDSGRKLLESKLNGSALQELSINVLRNVPVSIPPLPEQQKIAAILSTWDVAIDNCKAIIAKLKERNKGLAQQLLIGKIRVKDFEKTKWKWVAINKIAKEISLKNPSDKKLIVMSCTKYDGLVPSLEYFGRKIYSDDLTTYKIVKKGQFAYATNHIEEGSIGYQTKCDEALISPMYTVFQTDNTINNNLLFRILKSHEYIHQYQKRMEGSIDRRGGLRWDEFSKIKIPVIDLEEQNAINNILDTATAELNQYQQKLQTLQLQKKGLMQQLLTGKVRVKIK